jgi:hypothetical protein
MVDRNESEASIVNTKDMNEQDESRKDSLKNSQRILVIKNS